MEVKAPGRNKTSGDFNKLGFIMGNMLDDLVDIGIINPIVSGLLVDGKNRSHLHIFGNCVY